MILLKGMPINTSKADFQTSKMSTTHFNSLRSVECRETWKVRAVSQGSSYLENKPVFTRFNELETNDILLWH